MDFNLDTWPSWRVTEVRYPPTIIENGAEKFLVHLNSCMVLYQRLADDERPAVRPHTEVIPAAGIASVNALLRAMPSRSELTTIDALKEFVGTSTMPWECDDTNPYRIRPARFFDSVDVDLNLLGFGLPYVTDAGGDVRLGYGTISAYGSTPRIRRDSPVLLVDRVGSYRLGLMGLTHMDRPDAVVWGAQLQMESGL